MAVVTIDNFTGLRSILSAKELHEIKGTIASLVTNVPSSTMKFGQISESEYLLYFEHQKLDEVAHYFDQLKNGLAQILFAKVDNNRVAVTIGADTMCVSDVDPYQFLARLTLLQ